VFHHRIDFGFAHRVFESGHSFVLDAVSDIGVELFVHFCFHVGRGEVVGVDRFAIDGDFAAFAAVFVTGHAVDGVQVFAGFYCRNFGCGCS